MPSVSPSRTSTAFNKKPIGNGPYMLKEPWEHAPA